MEDIGSIVLIFAIILLNGTFVAAEFSIARLRKTQVDHIVNSRNPKNLPKHTAAKVLQKILSNINDYISACQVGITISSLVLGALAESRLEALIAPALDSLNLPWISDPRPISILLAITIITFFHVILGELIPKNLSIINPERTGLQLAFFLKFIHTVFRVPVFVLNTCSNIALKIIGVDVTASNSSHSEDELRLILSTSQEEGVIEEEEEKLIQNVFEFNDTIAKDIMRPRTDMYCLEAGISIAEATKHSNKKSYTKFPIFEKRLDNIVGYVNIKEILKAHEAGQTEAPIESIAKEILKVPDGLYIIDLIALMQQKKKQIAILIDEYGGTSGLVTVEDIVEEIFGEITDEIEETPDVPLKAIGDGTYIVDGTLTLREVNEELGSAFESEHYDTIGGFVYGLLASEPEDGASVYCKGFNLEVVEHSENRVLKVKISQEVSEKAKA